MSGRVSCCRGVAVLLCAGVLFIPAEGWATDLLQSTFSTTSNESCASSSGKDDCGESHLTEGDALQGSIGAPNVDSNNMQGCDPSSEERVDSTGRATDDVSVIVSFNLGGGHLPSTGASNLQLSVDLGGYVAKPENPVYDGRVFLGWYTDTGQLFDFDAPVTSDILLVARWSKFTGWNDSKTAWYDDGVMARSHCFFDPGSAAWYWADADGSIAAGKDVFIPRDESDRSKGGKWVRFETDRSMVKGQDCRYGGWYYFDVVTGEMAKGFAVPDGKKWCYYDPMTGKMQYGERLIDGGWYYLTPGTGAVDYEWAWLPNSNKWVYYDEVSGRMVHGPRMIGSSPYYFDNYTGERLNRNEIVEKLLRVVQSSYGTHPDCPAELKAAGGELCPYGPCMSYVWWCFHHAGLDIFLNNDEIRTGWPHQSYDWYRARGRVDRKASKGDIAFFNPTDWAPALGVSSSHAGIVLGTTSSGILIADASYGGIMPRVYSWRSISGIAHPYY